MPRSRKRKVIADDSEDDSPLNLVANTILNVSVPPVGPKHKACETPFRTPERSLAGLVNIPDTPSTTRTATPSLKVVHRRALPTPPEHTQRNVTKKAASIVSDSEPEAEPLIPVQSIRRPTAKQSKRIKSPQKKRQRKVRTPTPSTTDSEGDDIQQVLVGRPTQQKTNERTLRSRNKQIDPILLQHPTDTSDSESIVVQVKEITLRAAYRLGPCNSDHEDCDSEIDNFEQRHAESTQPIAAHGIAFHLHIERMSELPTCMKLSMAIDFKILTDLTLNLCPKTPAPIAELADDTRDWLLGIFALTQNLKTLKLSGFNSVVERKPDFKPSLVLPKLPKLADIDLQECRITAEDLNSILEATRSRIADVCSLFSLQDANKSSCTSLAVQLTGGLNGEALSRAIKNRYMAKSLKKLHIRCADAFDLEGFCASGIPSLGNSVETLQNFAIFSKKDIPFISAFTSLNQAPPSFRNSIRSLTFTTFAEREKLLMLTPFMNDEMWPALVKIESPSFAWRSPTVKRFCSAMADRNVEVSEG